MSSVIRNWGRTRTLEINSRLQFTHGNKTVCVRERKKEKEDRWVRRRSNRNREGTQGGESKRKRRGAKEINGTSILRQVTQVGTLRVAPPSFLSCLRNVERSFLRRSRKNAVFFFLLLKSAPSRFDRAIKNHERNNEFVFFSTAKRRPLLLISASQEIIIHASCLPGRQQAVSVFV